MAEAEDVIEEIRRLMKAKGLGLTRLASLTDIPIRFIDAILDGDFDNLPARPYIRGYLFKISNVLGAESDHLWQMYRASSEARASGEQDKLPVNRFALKRMNRGVVLWSTAGLVVLLLITINFNRIIGKPGIEVSVPEISYESVITVTGTINPEDRLTLNGEIIYTDDIGRFEKQVQLETGANHLEFKVSRYLGRETTLERDVVYQPPVEQEQPPIIEEELIPTDASEEETQ